MTISVVVPVFNGSATLPALVDAVSAVARTHALTLELLLVDDGSEDSSWDVIELLGEDYPWLRGFRLARNFGQENATLCGIQAARYPVIVTLDDDLQNPPEEIPHLLNKLAEGHSVVYGVPRRQRQSIARRLCAEAVKIFLEKILRVSAGRDISSFRAFRTDLREQFPRQCGLHLAVDVLLHQVTKDFAAVQVRNVPRAHGQSNYGPVKLVRHALTLLAGFSRIPFRTSAHRESYIVAATTSNSPATGERWARTASR